MILADIPIGGCFRDKEGRVGQVFDFNDFKAVIYPYPYTYSWDHIIPTKKVTPIDLKTFAISLAENLIKFMQDDDNAKLDSPPVDESIQTLSQLKPGQYFRLQSGILGCRVDMKHNDKRLQVVVYFSPDSMLWNYAEIVKDAPVNHLDYQSFILDLIEQCA